VRCRVGRWRLFAPAVALRVGISARPPRPQHMATNKAEGAASNKAEGGTSSSSAEETPAPNLPATLPTQRRSAINFRYTDDESFSMRKIGAMLPPVHSQTIESSAYREMSNVPTDSWEIEHCVGYAVQKILRPRWAELKQLGRSLTILKVHKDPQICELFFMPRDEVIKTYAGRFPKNVEWVHLYDPEVEIAFWAELYRPRRGATNTPGRRTLLTDELCGGSGSRFTVISKALEEDRLREHLSQAMETREETEERLAEARARIDKNRRKKEKRKEKKAEQRAAEEEEDRRQREEAEAEAAEAARSARMPAPMLKGVDWGSMLKAKEPAKESVGAAVDCD